MSNGSGGTAEDAPEVGRVTFKFRGPKDVDNPTFARGFTSDSQLTITTTAGTTQRYAIASGGLTGKEDAGSEPDDIYEVTLTKPLKDSEANVLASLSTQHAEFTLTLYEEQSVEKPEYFGRFFVKVNRDTVFDTNIIDSFPSAEADYGIIRDRIIDADSSNDYGTNGVFISVVIFSLTTIPVSPTWFEKSDKAQTLSWKDTKAKDNNKDHETGVRQDWRKLGSGYPALGAKEMTLYFTGVDTGLDKSMSHNGANTLNPFLEAIQPTGSFFQFENEDGYEGSIYEIESTTVDYQYRSGRKRHRKKIAGKRREYKVKFKNVQTGDGYDDGFLESGGTGKTKAIKAIRIMKKIVNLDSETLTSENPAIFETQPKEAIDLELFYEASNSIPIIKQGMKVTGTHIQANTTISSITDANTFVLSQATSGGTIADGSTLTITSADDVYLFTVTINGALTNGSTSVVIADGQVHGQLQTLDWFNCYSFGNGVESNRINDDFNAMLIDKGPKVSSVLAEQYKEDQKQNGLIWSGIFNSTSGINRLNQFIQAEPITKDVNPHYGSIQKLRARDTDLITFCEDKVIRILANKDALYNADGNPQLTATNRVLGQAVPYVGEYGISKNPESFASHAYRIYFTDKARGAVLRLSRDGLTNIAQNGMTDWFKDNLATSTVLVGSYNEYKGSYNLTLKGTNDYTVSFDERVNGWTSFKSFIPESAESLNNTYYSFKNADLYSHDNTVRNTFYGAAAESSSITVLINDIPSSMKSFKTLNYEGSRSRKYTYSGTIGGTSYSGLTWDQINPLNPTEGEWTGLTEAVGKGWYADSITTDKQSGKVKEFKDKEGKWFNYITGDTTTLTNLDSKEFSVQGIGTYASLGGDTTPSEKNVTITINNTTSSHNTDVSATLVLSKVPGASISESVTLTIKPNTGFTIAAGSFAFVSETSSTVADAMGTATFAQSGANVVMTVPLSFTMPSNDQTIRVNITGAAVGVSYSVAGKYNTVETNTTSSPANLEDVAYSGTGTYNTTAATVFTKTFTAREDKSTAYTNMSDAPFDFLTNTSDSDPGAGNIKFNNGSAASVTEIYIDDTKKGGGDKQSQYALLQNQDTVTKGYVRVADNGSTTNYTEFKVSAVAHNSGYWKLTVNTPTAGSGGHVGIAANEKDVTFYTVDGYKFNVKPTCEIIKQDEDDVSAYSIVETNWDGDQNQITFTVKYVYSTNNPTEDRLLFTAHAEKIFVDPDTQVTAFHASSKPISRRGEDRTMTIAGMEGVTFKFKKKYSIAGVDLDSNGAGNYSDFDFWNPALNSGAGGWQDGDATITMGNTGLYAITESYGSSSATKSFNYQINATTEHPILGGNLDADSDGDHDFIIGQNADVTFTVQATETIDGATSASPIGTATKTYFANGEPSDDADFGLISFSAVVTLPNTQDITQVVTPNASYFTNRESSTNCNAVSTSTTCELKEVNYGLVAGMTVEGTGVAAGVTIASVTNASEIVLSSAQTISNNTELTFKAPNGWEIDVNNVVGVVDNDASTHTYTLTADVEILRYGTSALTSVINLDNILSVASGGGSGGKGAGSAIIQVTDYGSLNLQDITIGTHQVTVGTANSTTFSGTATLGGLWSGNLPNQVIPGFNKTDSEAETPPGEQINSITFGSLTFTSGYASDGTATGTYTTGTCTYTITIVNDSGGNATAANLVTGYLGYVNVTFGNGGSNP